MQSSRIFWAQEEIGSSVPATNVSAPPTEEACSTQVEVEQREVNKEIIQLQQ